MMPSELFFDVLLALIVYDVMKLCWALGVVMWRELRR